MSANVGIRRYQSDDEIAVRDERDCERLFHLGYEMLRGIRAGLFLPNRGCWMCSDCEYRQDCDEWQGNDIDIKNPSPNFIRRWSGSRST